MYRIGKEELAAVERVFNSRALFKINATEQDSFHAEEEMKEIFGTSHALIMTSGHAALSSALIAMGIGPGDEVIVPAYTYISTAMAVVSAGAMPVIVDIDDSLTLCPKAFEEAITKNTKAVIPVHIRGLPCKMDEICSIAEKHGIMVLEDACQAVGGSYHGKRLGTVGDAGALSFNYFKVITTGEGGALFTDNKKIFENALIYHDSNAVAFFGDQLSGVEAELFCGTECRTNGITAAILREQLKRLDGILADLRKNKKYIMDAVADVCEFVPSNDPDGDCATTIAFRFDSTEEAEAFANAEGVYGTVPINTGKHIYKNWAPIMNKRGALHPLMDPFKMEANKDIVPDYRDDMCEYSLELLSKVAYITVSPDSSKENMDERIAYIRKALQK
ncbi:MAG: aminotransferase class V-fold PLP-dependent enzyme [Ruminococcaceae bacterium]|nr:aminotransferase class V-fold PLP-dependent enzyme [Oscillospiraceae bacterium]